MRNYSRKTAIFMLVTLFAGATPVFFPTRIEARDPRVTITTLDVWSLGGEPGEDPHLKTIPTISIQESELLRTNGYEGPTLLDESTTSSIGLREGRGRCLGSRMNLAWRMFLRTWFRQLHR